MSDNIPVPENNNEDSGELSAGEIAQPVTVEPVVEEPKIEETIEAALPVDTQEVPVELKPAPSAEETPSPPVPEPLPEPTSVVFPEPIIVSAPTQEPIVTPAPLVQPELVSVPAPTSIPEPIEAATEPTPEPEVIPGPVVPETTPQVAPITEPIAPPTPPIAPVVPVHDSKYTKDIPQKILELSVEEINAARLLWAREHIAEAQAQGNRNRRARMNKIMDEIEVMVKANPKTTTHAIANSVKLSERSTSGYIQKLVKAGRIKASGNSSNRRYFA